MPPRPPGPGLASAGPGRVVTRRTVRLLSVLDGWWARVLERADVVSEGSQVTEATGEVYYGSSSVRCHPEPRPHAIRQLDVPSLGRLLLADPHARLRLVRLARREAAARTRGTLGVVRVELSARVGSPVATDGDEREHIDVALDVSASVVDVAGSAAVP